MSRFRSTFFALLCSTLLVTAGAATAAAASAAPDGDPWGVVSHAPSPQRSLGSNAWTAARMAAAIPADGASATTAPPKAQPSAAPAADPLSVAPRPAAATPETSPASPAVTAKGLAADVNASVLVGKVFFHNTVDGLDYVCSGSSVNSTAQNVVLTAGHCVYDAGAWVTDWVFVPYYDHGNRPYGTWYAANLTTFTGWTQNSYREYDVAFVNVWNNSDTLGHTVGGEGLRTWSGIPQEVLGVTALGYPAGAPYDGEWQYYCLGDATLDTSDNTLGMPCPLTGGSSGGPWMQEYDNATGLGYDMGINESSTGSSMYSPPFTSAVADLYGQIQDDVYA
ncbi:trypsin-like serine peptidase [Streptomyces odontomachi]|uniref:trypsin-like serine peptidase n=1 Tax=Streptomyces odontomachi TaxID=2944940 RepID=UPI00210AE50A|nr:trypsin-like peptidase domain-containing protein [Streptomyces sp. ODS25]